MWWQSCSRPQAIYVHVPEQPLVQPERARIPGGDGTGPGADRIKGNTHRAEVGRRENPRSDRHLFTIVGVKSPLVLKNSVRRRVFPQGSFFRFLFFLR